MFITTLVLIQKLGKKFLIGKWMSQYMYYYMIKYYIAVSIVYKILHDMRKHLSAIEKSPIHKCV